MKINRISDLFSTGNCKLISKSLIILHGCRLCFFFPLACILPLFLIANILFLNIASFSCHPCFHLNLLEISCTIFCFLIESAILCLHAASIMFCILYYFYLESCLGFYLCLIFMVYIMF